MSDDLTWKNNATLYHIDIRKQQYGAYMSVGFNPFQGGWDWQVTVRFPGEDYAAFHDFGHADTAELAQQAALSAYNGWCDVTTLRD